MPAGRPMPPRRALPPSRSRPGSCSGSTATGSSRSTGFRARTARDYEMTPCLQPLARFRHDIHVLSGVDNPAARLPGPGNGHHNSMSGLVAGEMFSGRGAGGPSIDQVIAQKIGNDSRFRSLQIGVCQESFGESIQRNMSWAGRDRPLPPEMIPHRLFDRLFGSKEQYWIERKKSILDAVSGEAQVAEDGARPRRSAAAGGIPGLGPQPGAFGRQPAAGVFAGRRAAAGRGRPEGLAADREAADRPAGPCPGLAADAGGLLHADQVPGPLALPLAGLHLRAAPRIHARPRGNARRPADHARHLPLARRGVRLPPRQAQVDSRRATARCSITPARCSSTSTPKPIRTRTPAWP